MSSKAVRDWYDVPSKMSEKNVHSVVIFSWNKEKFLYKNIKIKIK